MGVCCPLSASDAADGADGAARELADLPAESSGEIQLHGLATRSEYAEAGTGLLRKQGKCAGTVVGSVRYGRIWSFAVRTIMPHNAMKSAPCGRTGLFAKFREVVQRAGIRRVRGLLSASALSIRHSMNSRGSVYASLPGLLPTRRLAVGIPARRAACFHSRVRPEPPATDSAGLFRARHRDLSSSSRLLPHGCGGQLECLGHFCEQRRVNSGGRRSRGGQRNIRMLINEDALSEPPLLAPRLSAWL